MSTNQMPSPLPEDSAKTPREERLRREHEAKSIAASPGNVALVVACVALVASRSVDQVLYYRLNFQYAFYTFYFSAIILPIAFLVMTVRGRVGRRVCVNRRRLLEVVRLLVVWHPFDTAYVRVPAHTLTRSHSYTPTHAHNRFPPTNRARSSSSASTPARSLRR